MNSKGWVFYEDKYGVRYYNKGIDPANYEYVYFD